MPGYEGMNECGATGCNECDAGTYAMGEGNSYCDDCQSGSYASSSGASECDVCPNNLYSNGQMDCWDGIPECGATECVDCNGQPWGDAIIDENGDCSESQSGCTYIEAYNFNPDAYLDDGTCLFPCQGDFNNDSNKDHVIVYESTIIATRPGSGVKKILSYEVLSSSEWNYNHPFSPNVFLCRELHLLNGT